MFSTKYLMSSI